ncbi:MAG: hypothetical protein SV253_09075 [Halobacteria archaeon]|nr:hypothetical protein [Halobacteria archaeon]
MSQSKPKSNGKAKSNGKVSPPPRIGGGVGVQAGEHIDDLTEVDIDPKSEKLLKNLFSQDFILGNLEDAEVNEQRELARCMVELVESAYPPEESVVKGEYRKVLLDDESDGKKALGSTEKTNLETALMTFLARVSRSREGWQQDKMSERINVQRTEGQSSSSKSKLQKFLFG